jgi:hypothetical protein
LRQFFDILEYQYALIAFCEIEMFILVIINEAKYILNNCERNAQSTRLISVCFDNIIICTKDKIVYLNKRKLANVFVYYKSIENLSNALSI